MLEQDLSGLAVAETPSIELKRHVSERYRGPATLFVERMTNAKAGLIGFYTGAGRLAPAIAKILADGTTPATIRALWRRWGLPKPGGTKAAVPVLLTWTERKLLAKRAKRVGVSPEEWARRVIIGATQGDLYDAVTDGAFDQPAPRRA